MSLVIWYNLVIRCSGILGATKSVVGFNLAKVVEPKFEVDGKCINTEVSSSR